MDAEEKNEIVLYTSRWCAHSVSVERFLDNNEVAVKRVSIDGNQVARQELIELNGGFASVPTLLFTDGTKLTEPSYDDIRSKLGLQSSPGLMDRVRSMLGGEDKAPTDSNSA